jgi:hypothetical protein
MITRLDNPDPAVECAARVELDTIIAHLVKAVKRRYLTSNLRGYQRDLAAIAAQRRNDFAAEKVIHEEMAVMRSQLHALEAA